MAAIFQIRRGTTNVSLTEGELYLHQGSGSLQFGSGSGAYNVLTLDAPVNGNVILTGNITASNAYFSGDVSISGNLFLGNNTGDNISVPGVFTTNLVPATSNAYDLGTNVSQWRTLYASSVSASFSGSINGINITALSTSIDAQLYNISIETASIENRLGTIQSLTSSYNDRFTSLASITGSLISTASVHETKINTIGTYTSSLETRMNAIATETASLETRMSAISIQTASFEARIDTLATLTGSLITTASNLTQRVSANEAVSGTYARTNSTNTFVGNQIVTGSMYVSGDLIVQGSSSIQNISSSVVNIGTNFINLNVNTPAIRFAGISVIDSGSTGATGSLVWDSLYNRWLYSQPSGSGAPYQSAILINGPENSGSLGSEQTLTANYVPVAQAGDHIRNSKIYTDGTTTSFGTNVYVTGSITSNSDIQANKFIFTDGVINTNISGQYMFATNGNILYLYTGTSGLNINNSANSAINVAITDNGDVTTRGLLTVGSPGNDKNIVFGGTNAGLYWASSGASITYSVGSVIISAVNGSNSLTIQNGGGINVIGGITGSIAATNGVVSGSSQVISILSSLNTFTGSQSTQNSTLAQITSSILSWTASAKIELSNLEATSASNNISIANLNTYTASLVQEFNSIHQTTASLNITTASINNFTASMTASYLALSSSVEYINRIGFGGYDVSGSFSQLFAESSSLEIRMSTLAQVTSSLMVATASLQTYTSSLKNAIGLNGQDVTINGNLTVLGTTTQINSTQVNIGDNILELNYGGSATTAGIYVKDATGGSQISGSLLWDSTADYWKAGTLGNETKVLLAGGDNVITSSTQLTQLNSFTASANVSITNLNNFTASVSTGSLVNSISQLNSWSASAKIELSNLETTTASLNTSVNNINNFTSSQLTQNSTLATYTGSTNTRLSNLETTSASVNVLITNLNSFSSSQLTQNTNLATITGSLITTASVNVISVTNLNAASSSYETKGRGIVSGSSQIDATLTTNWATGIKTQLNTNTVISGSSQILGGSAIHSGSTGDYQFNSIGVGTAGSGVSGEIRATGDIVAFYSSDERLKENIQPIQNALSKVEAISGNTYDWKEGFENIHSHKGIDLGVIAQEVQSILPEVVTERENGYLAVDYIKLVPVLIEAVKELSAKIKELENK